MDDLDSTSLRRLPRVPTVGGYLTLVWMHVGVITVMTIIGGLVGFALQARTPTAFVASASIELPDVPTSVDLQPGDAAPQRTTIDSTAQLLFATPVVNRVADVTNLTADKVRQELSVSAYPLSRVLIATFQAPSAALAIAGADGAAKALIHERRRALLGHQLRPAGRLSSHLLRLINRANRTVGPYNPVSRRLHDQVAQIQAVRQQGHTEHARIVDRASPARPVSTQPELTMTTGAFLGFLGGLAYAWWRPVRRDAVAR